MAFLTSLITLSLLSTIYLLGVFAQGYSITSYGANGSGCPPGTVSGGLSDNSKDISLSYNSFTVTTGPGTDDSDSRKNCQLTLSVKVPSGYQFAFGGFNHSASYTISSGVQATVSSLYYFQASASNAVGASSFTGPARFDGTVSHDYSSTIWSPCSQNAIVGINTAARVTNGSKDYAPGSLTLTATPSFGFIWRTC